MKMGSLYMLNVVILRKKLDSRGEAGVADKVGEVREAGTALYSGVSTDTEV